MKIVRNVLKGILLTAVISVCFIQQSSASVLLTQNLGQNAYSASSSWSSNASMAFDGNLSTPWNAGSFATSWIEVNLGAISDISQILLYINQQPSPAFTSHEIWTSVSSIGWNTAGATLAKQFSGITSNGQMLTADFAFPLSAQFLQIRTVASPSWVSWFEIQAFGPATVPEPGTINMLLAGLSLIFVIRHRRNRHV